VDQKYYISDQTIDFILFALEESIFLVQKESENCNPRKRPNWKTLFDIRDNMVAVENILKQAKGA
jgi:hypothetical protein